MVEEDNSDQITDSRKQLGGAGWVRRFFFWREGLELRLELLR